MSESRFLKEQVDAFLTAHKKDAGWKVYEFSGRLQYEISFGLLLDFLRDSHPDAVKTRLSANEVRTEDMQGIPGDSHSIEPGSEWDLNKDLDTAEWTGRAEVEWSKQPIHYLRVRIRAEGGRARLITLAAAKSNAALQGLHKALDEYVQARGKKAARHIIVVNGEDMPVPQVSWEDLILPDGLAQEIRGNVEAFFKDQTRERYKSLDIPYRRGFIFSGPPGCGKTFTLKALANNIPVTFIALHTRANVDEGDLERAFYFAKKHAPAILVFEDLDRLVRSKEIAMSYFLNILDGFKIHDGVLVIATSNSPERLDPALLHRPSRFDRMWRFSLPNAEQRLSLLTKKGGTFFSTRAIIEAATRSTGFSMAYTQEILVNALLECAQNGGTPKDEHLLRSLESLKMQRKTASKVEEDMAYRESIGFAPLGLRPPWTVPAKQDYQLSPFESGDEAI